MSALQNEIEARLAASEPDVEVLLAELVSGSTLRLFIDHPDGVTLALCERVSGRLNDYRDRYALEVSSPGQDRPLTKPQHYSRFLGRRARLRLRDATPDDADAPRLRARRTRAQSDEAGPDAEGAASSSGGRAGRGTARHKSVTGELVGASEREVTIAADGGILTIPYEQIARSNLVPGV